MSLDIQGGQLNIVNTLDGGILTVPADGVGIQTIIFNQDYSLTILLTDGTSYTSPPLIGPPGPGLPSGGMNNQMVLKDGSEDYQTRWAELVETGSDDNGDYLKFGNGLYIYWE